MRRTHAMFGVAVLLLAASLTFALLRSPPAVSESAPAATAPAPAAPRPPAPPSAPAPALTGVPAPVRPPAPAAATRATAPEAKPEDPEATRIETELAALEAEALRRLDVGPVLEAAGIDVRELRARPDGEEILRHVAGDEVLLRSTEREIFATTIYPEGYPREQAENDVREVALRMVSALTPEGRAAALAGELDMRRSVEAPEPAFHPEGSGRVYDAHGGESDKKDEGAND